jgi:CheY-like chemotaxis protein
LSVALAYLIRDGSIMKSPTRPPPVVLFVHDGLPYRTHVKYLEEAGLRVTEAHAHAAVTQATALQPDIIVLDFDCNGEVTEQLKANATTQHIPVIALVDLVRRE